MVSFNIEDGHQKSYSVSTGNIVRQVKKSNYKHNAFSLEDGDIIRIENMNDKITFRKQGVDETVSLDVHFTHQEWKEAVFFVNCWDAGD